MAVSPMDELKLKFAVVRIARQQLRRETQKAYQRNMAIRKREVRLIESQPASRTKKETIFTNHDLMYLPAEKFIKVATAILQGKMHQCGTQGRFYGLSE